MLSRRGHERLQEILVWSTVVAGIAGLAGILSARGGGDSGTLPQPRQRALGLTADTPVFATAAAVAAVGHAAPPPPPQTLR